MSCVLAARWSTFTSPAPSTPPPSFPAPYFNEKTSTCKTQYHFIVYAKGFENVNVFFTFKYILGQFLVFILVYKSPARKSETGQKGSKGFHRMTDLLKSSV